MVQQHRGSDEPSKKPLVAFLGPVSSFTHQATKSTFPGSEWELVPVVTIRDVFEVVQAGDADYGVVPFENSTHGAVTFTLDSLADRDGSYADLSICGEVYLDVHHFLLGHAAPAAAPPTGLPPLEDDAAGGVAGAAAAASSSDGSGTCTPTASQPHPLRPRARPLAALRHVRRVYSHPQAFGQTAAFLGAYLRGVDTVDVTSTSRAAQLAAEDPTGGSAAIAGEIAAEVHGLEVLARCIEDREDNTTRFFVIRRGAAGAGGEGVPPAPVRLAGLGGGEGSETGRPTGEEGEGAEAGKKQGGGKTKTMVSFTVPHQAPGALADVLDVFRKYGLNLTSINSVPSLIRPFQYLFFVEFEGSRHDDPEGRVEAAFGEVDKVAQGWRWLGSWENQRP
ncbi:Chorismate mutase prephenate dehydratase [Pleurostoma richardsiae]|uniref:prephenate dehydratase n=1 Tax=Pleurostoma richardsiae TaxID=41990 RepID=A0AA38S197_9PEZI|nr:Chorismate mutase prephenate dehydratase [Pleurostoma richardsiae]